MAWSMTIPENSRNSRIPVLRVSDASISTMESSVQMTAGIHSPCLTTVEGIRSMICMSATMGMSTSAVAASVAHFSQLVMITTVSIISTTKSAKTTSMVSCRMSKRKNSKFSTAFSETDKQHNSHDGKEKSHAKACLFSFLLYYFFKIKNVYILL